MRAARTGSIDAQAFGRSTQVGSDRERVAQGQTQAERVVDARRVIVDRGCSEQDFAQRVVVTSVTREHGNAVRRLAARRGARHAHADRAELAAEGRARGVAREQGGSRKSLVFVDFVEHEIGAAARSESHVREGPGVDAVHLGVGQPDTSVVARVEARAVVVDERVIVLGSIDANAHQSCAVAVAESGVSPRRTRRVAAVERARAGIGTLRPFWFEEDRAAEAQLIAGERCVRAVDLHAIE
jgi:hypothetical protein